MCKYKYSLTKIETSYIVALLNGTNSRFIDYKYEYVDTILLFLSIVFSFQLEPSLGSTT